MDVKGKAAGAMRSMTIWMNGAFLALWSAWPMVVDALPKLEEYVGADNYKLLTLVIGNVIMRFRTGQPLQDKQPIFKGQS